MVGTQQVAFQIGNDDMHGRQVQPDWLLSSLAVKIWWQTHCLLSPTFNALSFPIARQTQSSS